MGAGLAKGQIAAKYGQTYCAEGIRQGDEQSRLAIPAGAMGEDQAACSGVRGAVQIASNWRILIREVGEFFATVHRDPQFSAPGFLTIVWQPISEFGPTAGSASSGSEVLEQPQRKGALLRLQFPS